MWGTRITRTFPVQMPSKSCHLFFSFSILATKFLIMVIVLKFGRVLALLISMTKSNEGKGQNCYFSLFSSCKKGWNLLVSFRNNFKRLKSIFFFLKMQAFKDQNNVYLKDIIFRFKPFFKKIYQFFTIKVLRGSRMRFSPTWQSFMVLIGQVNSRITWVTLWIWVLDPFLLLLLITFALTNDPH